MAKTVSEETFYNTPNPQLYFAIHEAVDEHTNVSMESISEQRHIKAIKQALERQRKEQTGFQSVRTDSWARGYDKDQIKVDNAIIENYVTALRAKDARNGRQLAGDALIHSHLEGEEIEDYDVLLRGINIPDKEFVHPNKIPGYEDIRFPKSRTEASEVAADFVGINQDSKEIRAVRIVEDEYDTEQIEDIFHSAQTFVNSNYRDFSFEYELIQSQSLKDSNPVPPVYTGNIHYNGSNHLEPETEQVIDDLARRDIEKMLSGQKQKARV